MKDTGEHITNMLKTTRGAHPLFRSFGIRGVDNVQPIKRSEIAEAVAKWYPSVNRVTITRKGGDVNGGVEYNIDIVEE